MDLETCPWCRADLHHHCRPGACAWLRCRKDKGGCGVTIDPGRHHAYDMHGVPVEWPHTLPDD